MKNKHIIYSLILAFLGFIVATYLTILHLKHLIPPCTVTQNCEKVLTSQFAAIGPIPLALLGSLFYLTIIILCVLLLTNYKKLFLDLYYGFASLGFIASITLFLIQAYILQAFCQYCLLSEAISIGIIILAYFDFKGRKNNI